MRSLSLLLAALLLCCAVTPAAAAGFQFQFSDPVQESETQSAEEVPWTYPISLEILRDPLDVLLLVNKENLLDINYPPGNDSLYTLIDPSVRKSSSSEKLVRETIEEPLTALFEAAAADGANLVLHSAYRAYTTQSYMYENRLKDIGHDDGVVQKAGASDHQTGLGVDVLNKTWTDGRRMNEGFYDTTEGKWLDENCARFGFIIRYPKDRTESTGIIYEPWHLRYVGVEVAVYITENGLTLEEFTAEWRQELAVYYAAVGGMIDLSEFNL